LTDSRRTWENVAAVKRERRVSEQRGASVLEYTILVALVALVVVGAMTALGRQINTRLPDGVAPSTSTPPATTIPCPSTTTTPPGPTTTTAPGATTTTAPPGC
jgi:Flp pilus assembly pilin Flp